MIVNGTLKVEEGGTVDLTGASSSIPDGDAGRALQIKSGANLAVENCGTLVVGNTADVVDTMTAVNINNAMEYMENGSILRLAEEFKTYWAVYVNGGTLLCKTPETVNRVKLFPI